MHAKELQLVEDYWRDQVELVTALKESAVTRVPPLDAQPKDEDGFSSGDSRLKGMALAGEGSGLGAMSPLAQATRAALAAIGPPPLFNPLAQFMAHLQAEYGGFWRDQMHRIQDFCHKKRILSVPCIPGCHGWRQR